MAGSTYSALANKQAELIRKALQGSVFIASVDAPPIGATITDPADSMLLPLPESVGAALPWDDLGFLTNDGASFGNDISSSDVTSWGSFAPTRSDITADNTTLTVVCQETKLTTISLYTGADLSGATPAVGSGEIGISKPDRPSSKSYRVFSLAVDEGDGGEIYIGRFMPRGKVTGKAEQAFGGGDDPIGWGVTFQGQKDSALGYAERWYFAGPGWKALLVQMGFPAAV
jgi:hypothetical protein